MSKPKLEKIEITNSREIHVQVTEYKNKPVLDIRTFIKTASYTGYTQKGINIPLSSANELLEALKRVL